MKALSLSVTALGMLAGVTAAVPTAQAQAQDTGAALSPPMQQIAAAPQGQIMSSETLPARAATQRYVWKGGYVHGKWREGWVPAK